VSRRGFTLIELLVVVAVVALLISILALALSAVRETGRHAACLANLRSVLLGVQLYAEEHGDWLPVAEPPLREFPDARHWFMNAALLRHLGIEVPADPNGLPHGPPKGKSILICPSHLEPCYWRDGTKLDYALSYAVNGTWGVGGRPDHVEQRRLGEFLSASDAMAFTDACGTEVAPGVVLYHSCPQDNFDFRHGGRANVVFLDGHVVPFLRDGIPFGMEWRYESFRSAKLPAGLE
jgi:prepilin-type N-terminal cleavage/methylation domain-containing protein/prepilin-type processing-associated H-X9-DG protein